MAKKRPTHRNIRQGQTIYFINRHFEYGRRGFAEVEQHFLHSHKTPLPPLGDKPDKLNVNELKGWFKKNGDFIDIFFSRKKANTFCNRLNNKEAA
jgi:hypothetical protein